MGLRDPVPQKFYISDDRYYLQWNFTDHFRDKLEWKSNEILTMAFQVSTYWKFLPSVLFANGRFIIGNYGDGPTKGQHKATWWFFWMLSDVTWQEKYIMNWKLFFCPKKLSFKVVTVQPVGHRRPSFLASEPHLGSFPGAFSSPLPATTLLSPAVAVSLQPRCQLFPRLWSTSVTSWKLKNILKPPPLPPLILWRGRDLGTPSKIKV